MKILLVKDERIDVDLEKCADILNQICRYIEFKNYDIPIALANQSTYIDIKQEAIILNQKLSNIPRDYTLYITYRRYPDNYFAHSAKNTMIWSFWGWEYYTNLPIENGVFYIIADILALRIDRSFRHDELTGCIYDFLWDKTGIDMGMKMAHICGECLERIKNKAERSETLGKIIIDLIEILNILSNASRWSKSVFDVYKDKDILDLDWSTFEDKVAQLYRKLGAKVKQNVKLAGFQIDVYLEEETPSKQIVRTAVECKFHRKGKVGNKIVNDFYRVIKTLKEKGLIDKGIIVSYSGFSQDAYLVSQETGIELLCFNDLRQRAKEIPEEHVEKAETLINQKVSQLEKKREKSPDIFVIMPFSPELDDVYHLGIRDVAESLNCSCKRVDEMEFTGDILDEIYNSISNSKIIIAEVSNQNPNVYYELGFAHGLKKPVILITKDLSSTPFDLKMYNHIVYKNIVDLREKLKRRLEVILSGYGV